MKTLIPDLYNKLFHTANLSEVLNFLPNPRSLPFACSTIKGIHSPPDIIYRIELDGTTVVYTGHTAPVDLSRIAKNADYLVHEASETNASIARRVKHSTPIQAAKTAKSVDIRNLVIIHSPKFTHKQKPEVIRIFPRTIFSFDPTSEQARRNKPQSIKPRI